MLLKLKKYMSIEKYFKTQTEKKSKKNKIFKYIISIICFIIIIFSLCTIIQWYLNNANIKQINKNIEENTNIYNNNEYGELINPPNNENSNYYYYFELYYFLC